MTEIQERKEVTVAKEKRLIINRQILFTIPNILTYIRLLCVPVYMTLIILSGKPQYPDWYVFLALGIMVFAALTDVVDGKIARKYPSQGTYLGQCIDPIADKVMHVGALIALSIGNYLSWYFVIFIVLREFCMVIFGALMVNDVDIKSNMLGKVASATLSVGIILSFFHNYIKLLWGEFGIDWIVVTIGLVLNWVSAFNYAIVQIPAYLAVRKKKKLELAKKEETSENKE